MNETIQLSNSNTFQSIQSIAHFFQIIIITAKSTERMAEKMFSSDV